MPTKAMTARNTPTSRTSRFERFKLGLPGSCDRWQHCSTGQEAARLYQWARTIGRIRQETMHAAR